MVRVVKLGDHGPLILKKADLPGPIIAVCRCGLSAAWPLCDGSHASTRDESAGTLYRYERTEEGELVRHEIDEKIPGKAQVSEKEIGRSYA